MKKKTFFIGNVCVCVYRSNSSSGGIGVINGRAAIFSLAFPTFIVVCSIFGNICRGSILQTGGTDKRRREREVT